MSDQSVAIQLPNNLFAGKTAIVTGASRGVGRATALRLAEGGANVVVNYISNHREAQETVDLCLGKGVEAIAVCADVGGLPPRLCSARRYGRRRGADSMSLAGLSSVAGGES